MSLTHVFARRPTPKGHRTSHGLPRQTDSLVLVRLVLLHGPLLLRIDVANLREQGTAIERHGRGQLRVDTAGWGVLIVQDPNVTGVEGRELLRVPAEGERHGTILVDRPAVAVEVLLDDRSNLDLLEGLETVLGDLVQDLERPTSGRQCDRLVDEELHEEEVGQNVPNDPVADLHADGLEHEGHGLGRQLAERLGLPHPFSGRRPGRLGRPGSRGPEQRLESPVPDEVGERPNPSRIVVQLSVHERPGTLERRLLEVGQGLRERPLVTLRELLLLGLTTKGRLLLLLPNSRRPLVAHAVPGHARDERR